MIASETRSMEAVFIKCFDQSNHVLVVKVGGLDARFSQLCEHHEIPYTDIVLQSGANLLRKDCINRMARDSLAC